MNPGRIKPHPPVSGHWTSLELKCRMSPFPRPSRQARRGPRDGLVESVNQSLLRYFFHLLRSVKSSNDPSDIPWNSGAYCKRWRWHLLFSLFTVGENTKAGLERIDLWDVLESCDLHPILARFK